MLPARNKKPTDDQFVQIQLERIDSESMPPQDLPVLEAMALAPAAKPLEVMPRTQTATEARMESVNNLLTEAYKRASQLELTDGEEKALSAPFDDADFYRGAGGNQDLIYISHDALRMRLSNVLGRKWSLIIRRSWSEPFKAGSPPKDAIRVYVEGVLLVRGVYVAEAIGDGVYYPHNAATCYSDAYEIATSSTLRRLCKSFGVGLQAWNKDFAEKWKAKYSGFKRPERIQK